MSESRAAYGSANMVNSKPHDFRSHLVPRGSEHASPLPVPPPRRALVDLGKVSKLQKIPGLGLAL